MKNLIILLLLSIATLDVVAQKIYFTDTTNVWTYFRDPYEGNSHRVDTYIQDTIVNGYTYQLFEGKPWVREDTSAGMVYYSDNLDSPDKVLYNYNLELGDTVVSTRYSTSDTFILTTLDTIEIDGLPYKRQFYTQKNKWSETQAIIEGIGCMEEGFLLMPIHPNPGYFLGCFKNKGRIPILTDQGTPFSDSVTCKLTSVKEAHNENAELKIIPHPANNSSILQLPVLMQNGTLTIINTLGQQVIRIPISQQKEIPIGNMLHIPGLYTYYLLDNTKGKIISGKIVFE